MIPFEDLPAVKALRKSEASAPAEDAAPSLAIRGQDETAHQTPKDLPSELTSLRGEVAELTRWKEGATLNYQDQVKRAETAEAEVERLKGENTELTRAVSRISFNAGRKLATLTAHRDSLQALVDDVPPTWKADGYTSPEAEIADMANVGRSLIEAITDNTTSGPLEGWQPMDGPTEIVVDLLDMLSDSQAQVDTMVKAVTYTLRWASARCPCHNDEPKICPLCDADVARDSCKAVPATFPPSLLSLLRAAASALPKEGE